MCLCAPRLPAALASGEVARAIALLLEPCTGGRCLPAQLVEWLNAIAKDHAYSRELSRDHALRLRILQLYASADELPPEAVERLWRSEGEVGVAWFPVVSDGGGTGHLHAIHVGPAPAAVQQGIDRSFLDAIESARALTLSRFARGACRRRVERAGVRILPLPPERLSEDSVAFAAFVAFASLATGAPVRPTLAFSGVLSDSDFILPSRSTIGEKLRAVRSHGQFSALVCPSPHDELLVAGPERSWLRQLSWERALVEGLGRSPEELDDEMRAEPPLSGAGRSIPEHAQAGERARSERVLALLSAAGEQWLSLYELELAVEQQGVWPEPLSFGDRPVRDVLGQLVDAGQAIEQGTFGALRPTSSPRQLELAHQALDQVFSQVEQPARRAWHLLALKRWEDAAGCLEAEVQAAGQARGAAEVLGLMKRVALAERDHLHPLLAKRRLPQTLLVALTCADLPPPFASLAERLAESESSVDRLFWIQSVAEALLHILAAMALSLERKANPGGFASEGTPAAQYEERPSIGILEMLAESLNRAPGSPEAARSVVKLLPRKLAQRFNDLLHCNGAWLSLVSRPEGEIESKAEELASLLLPALAALRRANPSLRGGSPGEPLVLGFGDECHVSLGAHASMFQDGEVLFYRGRLDGFLRYWSFASANSAAAPDRGVRAPPQALVAPPWIEAADALGPTAGDARRNLAVDFLPQPIALAAIAQRARGLSAFERAACVEAAVGAYLRLALAAELSAAPTPPLAEPQRTKRAFLKIILNASSASTPLGAHLREVPARRLMLALIDALERLEHTPAPISSWHPLVVRAESLLHELLQGCPYVTSRGSCAILWRKQAEAPAYRLHGPRPKHEKGRALPGEIEGVFLVVGEERPVPLRPYVDVLASGEPTTPHMQLFGAIKKEPTEFYAIVRTSDQLPIRMTSVAGLSVRPARS